MPVIVLVVAVIMLGVGALKRRRKPVRFVVLAQNGAVGRTDVRHVTNLAGA